MSIGAVGVHTSGTSSPGSSTRHPTVKVSTGKQGQAVSNSIRWAGFATRPVDSTSPLGPAVHDFGLGPSHIIPHPAAVAAYAVMAPLMPGTNFITVAPTGHGLAHPADMAHAHACPSLMATTCMLSALHSARANQALHA